jgi:hypothetical protein
LFLLDFFLVERYVSVISYKFGHITGNFLQLCEAAHTLDFYLYVFYYFSLFRLDYCLSFCVTNSFHRVGKPALSEDFEMPIEFELCQDPQLLEQYYQLREKCFRQELKITDFDGSEDERDREGQILIARIGDRCVGGARIVPGSPLQYQLDDLEHVMETCCMWERFVFDPAVRTVQLIRDFCAELIDASRRFNYDYALVLSSRRNARFYRQCHSALGVEFNIHRRMPDAAQGVFAGLEHYLSISKLTQATAVKIAA